MKSMNMLWRYLQNPKTIMLVVFIMVFDIFVGILRSIKEKRINSSIGIDGLIRKVAMMGCLCFLMILDFMMNINLIGWLPQEFLDVFQVLGFSIVGTTDIFSLMFVLFEILSLIKNWTLLGLPMFKGINTWVCHFLETFTDEMPTTNKNI